MRRQQILGGNPPLEPSLTNLILNPKSEKIRRPPNAFMLFAREHRKFIANQNPDVSNKVVSRMLGQIWKNTAENVKEKYFAKSQMLDELHKRQYPNYVYSPREARLQKMNRKKKKDSITPTVAIMKTENVDAVIKTSQQEEKCEEEHWEEETSHNEQRSPEYVPNNLDFFTQQSPDTNHEEPSGPEHCESFESESELQYEQATDVSMDQDQKRNDEEIGCRWSKMSGSCGCCSTDKFERREDATSSHFPNHFQYSHAASSPFFNASAHFPRPINSFCCGASPYPSQIPRPYVSPFYPYWSTPMMSPRYCQNRDSIYDDINHFPYPSPYYSPDFFRPPFGYFDRHVAPHGIHPSSAFYPPLNKNCDHSQHLKNTFVANNTESRPCADGSNDKMEDLFNSTSKVFPNEKQFQTHENNKDDSACFSKSESNPLEAPNPYPFTCDSGISPESKLDNQYDVKGQTHSFIQDPENERKELPVKECILGNQNLCYSSQAKNRNQDYLIDFNGQKQVQEISENVSSSVPSPYDRNIPKTDIENNENAHMEKNINLEIPDTKYYKSCDFVSFESKASQIKRNTGINPIFTNNKFQEMCSRPSEASRNTTTRTPAASIKKPSDTMNNTASEIDLSTENEVYTTDNVHLEPIYVNRIPEQTTARKTFNTVSKTNPQKLQNVKMNDAVIVSQDSYFLRDVNKEFSATDRRNKDQKNYFFKSSIESDKNFPTVPANQVEIDIHEYQGYVNNSNAYFKNLAGNLESPQNYIDITNLRMNKSNLNCMTQQDLTKKYYKQKDGSFIAEDKLHKFNK